MWHQVGKWQVFLTFIWENYTEVLGKIISSSGNMYFYMVKDVQETVNE
jgi:hypothetical protein